MKKEKEKLRNQKGKNRSRKRGGYKVKIKTIKNSQIKMKELLNSVKTTIFSHKRSLILNKIKKTLILIHSKVQKMRGLDR